MDYLAGSHFLTTPSLIKDFGNNFSIDMLESSNKSFEKQLCGTTAHFYERLLFSFARSRAARIIWV